MYVPVVLVLVPVPVSVSVSALAGRTDRPIWRAGSSVIQRFQVISLFACVPVVRVLCCDVLLCLQR